MITVTLADTTYDISLSRGHGDTRTGVSIYRDDVWVGAGRLDDNGEIIDCPADLGDEVYDALDEAIADAFARGLYADCDPAE